MRFKRKWDKVKQPLDRLLATMVVPDGSGDALLRLPERKNPHHLRVEVHRLLDLLRNLTFAIQNQAQGVRWAVLTQIAILQTRGAIAQVTLSFDRTTPRTQNERPTHPNQQIQWRGERRGVQARGLRWNWGASERREESSGFMMGLLGAKAGLEPVVLASRAAPSQGSVCRLPECRGCVVR